MPLLLPPLLVLVTLLPLLLLLVLPAVALVLLPAVVAVVEEVGPQRRRMRDLTAQASSSWSMSCMRYLRRQQLPWQQHQLLG